MEVVFLVDDDDGVRRALSRMLRAEGFEVHAYASGEEFLSQLPASPPRGCLILDVSMPGLSGPELQEQLLRRGVSLPIVFLSAHGSIPITVHAIKKGAANFLTKPVSGETLIQAARDAIREHVSRSQEDANLAGIRQRYRMLTLREREVLRALASGKLNKQIADELGIVEQTVKFHRSRIMERMQARTVAELMHMAARLDVKAQAPRADEA